MAKRKKRIILYGLISQIGKENYKVLPYFYHYKKEKWRN